MASSDVVVRLRVENGQLVAAIDQAGRKLEGFGDKAKREFRNAGSEAGQLSSKIGTVTGALLGLAGVTGGVAAITKLGDEFKSLQARLQIATQGVGSAAEAYKQLYSIAQETRTPISDLAATFGRLAEAGKTLGVSQERLLGVTKTISQAMTISGGSAESMRAALVQLGQGLASGTLRGEELNSVLEQTPRLAQAIAEGMGVTRGELRQLGMDGKITADALIAAMERAADSVRRDFEQMPLTVSGALEQLKNSLLNTVGELDKATSASSGLATAIKVLADNADILLAAVTALTAVGLAAWISSAVAAGGALAAVLAALTAPITLTVAAVAALAGGFYVLWNRMREGRENVDIAKAKLAELRSELERQPNNLMLKSYVRDQRELVAALELRAQTEREAAGQMRGLAALQRQQAQEDKARGDRLKFLAEQAREAAGQSKDFEEKLLKLNAAYRAGDLTLEAYKTRVEDLIEREGGGKRITQEWNEQLKKRDEALKNVDAAFAAEQETAKNWAKAYEDAAGRLDKATAASDNLSDSQRALRDYLKYTYEAMRKISPEAAQMTVQLYLQAIAAEKAGDAQREMVDKMREIARAHRETVDALWEASAAVDADIKALEDDMKATALAAEKKISLAEAIQLVTIARLEEKRAAIMDEGIGGIGEAAVAAIDREIEARRRLLATLGAKRTRDNIADQAKTAADEWKAVANDIERALTDALVRGFEGGKGVVKSIGEYIVGYFKSTVARGIAQSIVGALTGALSSTASASTGGGGNILGSIIGSVFSSGGGAGGGISSLLSGGGGLSALGSVFSLLGGGGTFGTAASYGLMGTLFGSGTGAMMGAAGNMIGAGSTVAGMGTAIGAAAPYIAAAYAAYRIISGKGTGRDRTPAAGHQGIGTITGDAFNLQGLNPAFANEFGRTQTSDEMQQYVKLASDSLIQMARSLGGTLGTVTIGARRSISKEMSDLASVAVWNNATGQTWGPEGWRGSEGLTYRGTAEGIEGDEAAAKFFAEQLPKVILAGLQQADLAKPFKDFFAAIDVSEATKEQVEAALQTAQAAYEFSKALASLGGNLAVLPNLAVETQIALRDMMGGTAQAINLIGAYQQEFFTQGEREALLRKQITAALAEVNVAMPTTRAEFRRLVESQDLTTESGRETFATLMKVAGAFASVTPEAVTAAEAIDELAETMRSAEDIARERADLERQLLELQGDTAALRALDLAALDPSNRALQQRIWALQDEQAAAEAATAAAQEASAALDALIASSGITADGLGELLSRGLLDSGAGDEIGQALGDMVQQGIEQALAGSFAAQIAEMFTQTIVAPMLTAVTTGGQIATAVSQASINAVVAQATAAAQRFAAVMQSADFLDAMLRIRAAVASITVAVTGSGITGSAALARARAAAAAEAERRRAAAEQEATRIGNERYKLETEMLKLQGNVNALRERELLALDRSNRGIQRQIWALEDARAAREAELDAIIQVSRDRISELRPIVDLIDSTLSDLVRESRTGMTAAQGQQFLTQAAVTAQRTGYLPEREQIETAITAARSTVGRFASATDERRAQLQLAHSLSVLGDVAEGQLSDAEVALTVAQDQLTALRNIEKGINIMAGIGAGGVGPVGGGMGGGIVIGPMLAGTQAGAALSFGDVSPDMLEQVGLTVGELKPAALAEVEQERKMVQRITDEGMPDAGVGEPTWGTGSQSLAEMLGISAPTMSDEQIKAEAIKKAEAQVQKNYELWGWKQSPEQWEAQKAQMMEQFTAAEEERLRAEGGTAGEVNPLAAMGDMTKPERLTLLLLDQIRKDGFQTAWHSTRTSRLLNRWRVMTDCGEAMAVDNSCSGNYG